MVDDTGIFASLGVRVSSFFAGTAGGLVGAWFDDKASLRIWIIYAIGGGFTANYLGLDARHFAPEWMSELGLGFAIGVVAPIVIGTIKAVARKWQPTQTGGGKA